MRMVVVVVVVVVVFVFPDHHHWANLMGNENQIVAPRIDARKMQEHASLSSRDTHR